VEVELEVDGDRDGNLYFLDQVRPCCSWYCILGEGKIFDQQVVRKLSILTKEKRSCCGNNGFLQSKLRSRPCNKITKKPDQSSSLSFLSIQANAVQTNSNRESKAMAIAASFAVRPKAKT
jgi:hypothetical protein